MSKTRCSICERNFKNEEALEHHKASKHTQEYVPKKSKKPKTIFAIIFIAIIVIVASILMFSTPSSGNGEYDTFAQCLTEKGVSMYGAYWCPHCDQQKDSFGKSFDHVDYIECSLPNRGGQTAECNVARIESYPTWEFPDGTRVLGFQALEALSEESGCPLIKDIENE